MVASFLHGVEIIEIDDGPRPIQSAASAVIGIVGSAPIGPVNTPVLIANNRVTAASTFGDDTAFTLPAGFDDIFDQAGAVIVAVNVCDPAVHKTVVAAADRTITAKLITLPNRWITAVTVKAAGGAGATLLAGTDYTLDAAAGTIAIKPGGALASAASANVGYTFTDPTKVTLADVVGGESGTTGAYSGTHVLLAAKSAVAVTPRILCAPGFTDARPTGLANPVATELLVLAERLRAVVIIDGPSTTDAAAITARGDFGSRRAYIVDPKVMVYNTATDAYVARPASGRVAGIIARVDDEEGFWVSPSNHLVNGIGGLARPIDFALGDAAARANLLNASQVTTIIQQDGFRLWGNRTCSTDAQWAFLSVVRIEDMIHESLLAAHLWAVDRNITRTYANEVAEGVNDYLRDLQTKGAILGGKCWADPAQNPPSAIAAGHVTFDFDFTPTYPAERVTFRQILTTKYAATLFT